MAKQTFTTGQVLTAAQMTSLQDTAMGGGNTTAKTASYVLVAADAGTVVAMNAAGATTITVDTALFAAGDTVTIQNRGAGVCTITAGTATVVTAGSLALAQNEGGILYFTATGAATFYDFVQASGSSVPTSLEFTAGKNKIINGDFRVNQRNLTSTTTDNVFGFDRWRQFCSGGTVTYSSQSFTPGAAPVAGYEGSTFARVVTSGQSAAGDLSILNQPIEDVRTFAGQSAILSFWAKAASGTPKIAFEIEQSFGTGGSPSSNVNTYVAQVTLSTSWTRYTIPVSVPSISGKTLGTTANTSYLGILLWLSAGSTFNSRSGSLGVQNNTFDIWGVQLEAGSTATSFQTATGTIQGELAACQRYYFRTDSPNTYGCHSTTAFMLSSTAVYSITKLPVNLRVTPSSFDFSNIAFFNVADTKFALTSPTLNGAQSNTSHGIFSATISGGTANNVGRILSDNTTSGYIGYSAEF
jgi:hypothetical protein